MNTYIYKVQRIPELTSRDGFEEILNEWGDGGWRLQSVIRIDYELMLIFEKKSIQKPEAPISLPGHGPDIELKG